MTTALPSKLCKANEEEGDQGTLGEEICRQKWGQQDSSTAGGKWMRLLKTELDGEKWSVACAPMRLTRHKPSQVKSSQVKVMLMIMMMLCYINVRSMANILSAIFVLAGELSSGRFSK